MTIRQGYLDPIAYTYEADHHCPTCAARAFGVDPETGFIPETARDYESNPIGAVFPWDEWHEPSEHAAQTLNCGTCGVLIDTVDARDKFTVIGHTPGYLPEDDDPATFETYAEAVAYMNEEAARYSDDADANYRVEYGYASGDNYAAVMVWDDDKSHDLGFVIEVLAIEED